MVNRIKAFLATAVLVAFVAPLAAHNHGSMTTKNIVETAAGAGQFETLLAAATAAGLVPALTGDQTLTVFAPTDEAFGALPAGTIESLLEEKNKDLLTRILSFHVVAGKVGSDALADQATLATLAGPAMRFTQTEKGFSVEGARILQTDIQASNGVVHVIDRVIMPPASMSRAQAQDMIINTVNKGAPMFNLGNHTGTVSLYQHTAQMLMSSAQLTSDERQQLSQAMRSSTDSDSASEQAWALRHGLDAVMMSLQHTTAMTTQVR